MKSSKFARLVCCLALTMQITSCGLLDFELDEEAVQTATEMLLNYDTVYVMRGDTFTIDPVFNPDTVNIKDLYIRSTNEDVVKVKANRVEAVGEGHCKLYIESVSARLKDSCVVFVMIPWEASAKYYPYETVFYSQVTVNGKALGPDMVVGAFVGSECRALGKAYTFNNIPLFIFRVGSMSLYEGGGTKWDVDDSPDPDAEIDEEGEGDEEMEDDDEVPEPDQGGEAQVYTERIVFRCYDKRGRILYICPTPADFDGESHGTLSNLYQIKF